MSFKWIFLSFFMLCLGFVTAQTRLIIHLENSLPFDRNEVVAVSWNDIKEFYPEIDSSKIIVLDPKTGNQIAYQLETHGESIIQNLLIYADISAGKHKEYSIETGVPQNFPPKTFCRYVPERKDDFAWENDCIAFRIYGKALENTNGNGYGIDVWAKKVNYPIIDKWYKMNDYHGEHGEGHDFYTVGLTLGAGDMAPFENDKIWYPNNYRRWKILDNGPLRSCFCLEYDGWDVNGRQVTVTKTISIDAGSQLNKIEHFYTWNNKKPLILVAGLVKHKSGGTIFFNETKGMAAYWEPAYEQSGTIGTAYFLNQCSARLTNNEQILDAIELPKSGTITYYSGAVWDKAGKITSDDTWFDYLNQQATIINSPIKVNLKK